MEILKKEIMPPDAVLELVFILPIILRDKNSSLSYNNKPRLFYASQYDAKKSLIPQYDAKNIFMNYSLGNNTINYKSSRRVWNNFDRLNIIIHDFNINILHFKLNPIILEWYDLYINSSIYNRRDITGHIIANWHQGLTGDLLYRVVFNDVEIINIAESILTFKADYYTEVEI